VRAPRSSDEEAQALVHAEGEAGNAPAGRVREANDLAHRVDRLARDPRRGRENAEVVARRYAGSGMS
jgi:hypothetical protein